MSSLALLGYVMFARPMARYSGFYSAIPRLSYSTAAKNSGKTTAAGRLSQTRLIATFSRSPPRQTWIRGSHNKTLLRTCRDEHPTRIVGQLRRSSTNAPGSYEAVVVGSGPAGITAVGNLLETRIEPILWVDESFRGGRINEYYREVPSNTKVKLFIDFATGTEPFRQVVRGHPSPGSSDKSNWNGEVSKRDVPDKLEAMRHLEPEKGCQLSYPADMSLMLAEGLTEFPGVTKHIGRVTEASFNENSPSSRWTIQVEDTTHGSKDVSTVQTKRLILCTGAAPVDPPLPVDVPGLQHLYLDDVLSPNKLSDIFLDDRPTNVAVIGASHSAILVLKNLEDWSIQALHKLTIKWFTRHPLRYAEFEKDFIAFDNTGLKGEAAVWAHENLEPDALAKNPTHSHIEKIAYEKGAEKEEYSKHLPGCEFIVQAVGFQLNPIPVLKSENGEVIKPSFDHDNGWFNYTRNGEQVRLPGLYGAGIAFPERVIDRKYGHEEMNVGFFKFMKAVKKWVAHWK